MTGARAMLAGAAGLALPILALSAFDPAFAAPLAIASILVAAAFVGTVAGFAFSALAGAPLALVGLSPTRAVAILLVCSIAIQLYAVWRLRGDIRLRPMLPYLCGAALTVPLGVAALVNVSPTTFALALGVVAVGYGLYALTPVARAVPRAADAVMREPRWLAALVGAAGGFAGGFAAFPGLPLVIWCTARGMDKRCQRTLCQPFILVTQAMALGWFGIRAPAEMLISAAPHLPLVLLAAHFGFVVFQRLSQDQFRRVVTWTLILSGAVLLARNL